ncbi:MAG TPA: nuclear transport factor 2 family protein [Candidatus Nitrosopolaris sp.]|nr:nuclear transport factor 2 family protein [Candidatus Nitrosopolaris sp.]
MKTRIRNKKRSLLSDDKDIVFEYFRLIKNKDLEHLLDLFAYDAVVYEPFSKLAGGLRGRSAIESFLKVAIMANDALKHEIIIEKKPYTTIDDNSGNKDDNTISYGKNNSNKSINALVTFERGDSATARFTFELNSDDEDSNNSGDRVFHSKQKMIKTLHIQFIK